LDYAISLKAWVEQLPKKPVPWSDQFLHIYRVFRPNSRDV